jgi:hypothetical protein
VGSNPAAACYVVHLTPDQGGVYDWFTDPLAEEPLRTQWWDDAESEHEPDTSYLMVLVDENGLMTPAAWAGYRLVDGVLRCCNNYVRREYRGRNPELYAMAYAARHAEVVTVLNMPAVTYLYAQPIALHEADGWVKDTGSDSHGSSYARPGGQEHLWWRLRRDPR